MTSLRSILPDARSIRPRIANANTSLSVEDRGGAVRKTAAGAVTYTIDTDAASGWDDAASILCCNDSTSGTLTISPAATVTLTAGTAVGPVAIPPGESRLLHRVDPNDWRAR